MSPSAGVATWQKAARPAGARGVQWVAAAACALMLGAWLAGFFFLWSMRADPREATPLTVSQYAYYYGDQLRVRRRLLGSCTLSLTILSVALAATLLPRRRALHGDARFATRAEIRAAGLLGHDG